MTIAKYFWDLNETALKKTRRILQNPTDPQFLERMVTFLSRCDKPKVLFAILPKKKFADAWPKIRTHWMKKLRFSVERDWWDTLHEQLTKDDKDPLLHSSTKSSLFFKKIGRALKDKRVALGFSQNQLALRAGLRQPVISKIEEGKINVTLLTLIRMCKALDIKTIDVG